MRTFDEQERQRRIAEFDARRVAAQQIQQAQRDQWARDNERARAERIAKVEAEAAARAAAAEAELDRELEPERTRELHTWLAAHPGLTEENFNRDAWPHLRANLKAAHEAEAQRRLEEQMRSSGKYAPL